MPLPMPSPGARLQRRCTPAGAAALVFAVLACLYLLGAGRAYRGIIQAWGVAPFGFPFLDTDMVLSGLRCVRRGIDVYVTNPCDALHRIYDYAPLWLVLARTPLATLPLAVVGLAVDLCFLASLLLLPPARSGLGTVLVTAGTLSTAAVFALERGNTDLVILTLAICATCLVGRGPPARGLGYALATLAGLLKYYPMVLLALALRERPRALLGIAAAVASTLAAVVICEGTDLRRALALIPTGSYFGDMFGARTLPMGAAQLLQPWLTHRAALLLEFALSAAAVAIGARTGIDPGVATDLGRLTEPERCTLMAGALLVLGCFFTAQNIGYRAIDLLPVLPALATLRDIGTHKRLHTATLSLALVLLWSEGWRHWLHAAARPVLGASAAAGLALAAWLVREAAWWSAVTLLIAYLTALATRLVAAQRRSIPPTPTPAPTRPATHSPPPPTPAR